MSELRNRRYSEPGDFPEIALPVGDVTEGVVRVGSTVRRPHQPGSYAVAAYLDYLERVGFDGSPRFLGRDLAGRDVLTFVEGDTAASVLEPWALTDALLGSVAHLVRRLHAASAGYVPHAEPFPPRPFDQEPTELITHLDLTPQNVVVRNGEAIGLIDFDLAGPSTRFLDSYNTAMHWVPLRDPGDLPPELDGIDQFGRLRLFADAYGWSADERRQLPRVGADHAVRSRLRMRHNAETIGGGWARMWAHGVGELIERRGRWLLAEESAIRLAMLD